MQEISLSLDKKIKNKERERRHVIMNEVLMKSTAQFHYGFSVAALRADPCGFFIEIKGG